MTSTDEDDEIQYLSDDSSLHDDLDLDYDLDLENESSEDDYFDPEFAAQLAEY